MVVCVTPGCAECEKRVKDQSVPDWAKLCLNCYKTKKAEKDAVGYRNCNACNKDTISNSDPEWRKVCGKCYAEGINNCRECKQCKQKRVPGYEPQWKQICTECYKANRTTAVANA
jgi:hypothetical protein